MKLEKVERTLDNKKAFKATFIKENGKKKITRFGTGSNFVLNKKKTEQDKINYLKRHKVNENWNDPTSAGSLSKNLLWGDSRNMKSNLRDFKTKFKL